MQFIFLKYTWWLFLSYSTINKTAIKPAFTFICHLFLLTRCSSFSNITHVHYLTVPINTSELTEQDQIIINRLRNDHTITATYYTIEEINLAKK